MRQTALCDARILVALQNIVDLRFSREILRKPRRSGRAQHGVKRRTAKIGVDEQNAVVSAARQAHGQICHDKGLAFRRHSAADEDRLERSKIVELVNLRPQAAKLLDAFAAIADRWEGNQRWTPRMQGDLVKEDVVLDRWQLLCDGNGKLLVRLRLACILRGFPLKICPLKCIVDSAHISRSFIQSASLAVALMVLGPWMG